MKTLKKVLILCLLLTLSVALLTACGDDIDAFQKDNYKKFTITYDVNGEGAVFIDNGYVHKENTYTGGQKLTMPDDPVREGYDFGGWYKDKACTQAVTPGWATADTMTLYAKWDKKPSYRFEFYLKETGENGAVTDTLLFSFDNLYKESKISSSDIKKKIDEVKQNPDIVGKYDNGDYKLSFSFRNSSGSLFSYNTTVKVEGYIDKTEKDANGVGVYKLYTKPVPIERSFSFRSGNTTIAKIKMLEGKFSFAKAEDGQNALLTDDDFVLDEKGNRLMPKAMNLVGKKFVQWKVVTIEKDEYNKDKEVFTYYDANGNKIENGISTSERFIDRTDFEDIDRVEAETEPIKLTVEYYVYGNNEALVQKDSKVVTYDYKVPEPQLEGKKPTYWTYLEANAYMGVKANQKVDFAKDLVKGIETTVIKVVAYFEEVPQKVIFQKGDNQYFGDKDLTSYSYSLEYLNAMLFKGADRTGLDRILGGMYYEWPEKINVPFGKENVVKSQELTDKEKSVLRALYVFKGLQDKNGNLILEPKVEKGQIKLVSVTGKEIKFEGERLVLSPKFELRNDLKVMIDKTSDAKLLGEYDNDGTYYYYTTDFKNNTHSIPTITRTGYTFEGWKIKEIKDGKEIVLENNAYMVKNVTFDVNYVGATFNKNYNVLSDIVIEPVWKPIDYKVTFNASNGANLFEFTYTVLDRLKDADIAKVNNEIQNLLPNVKEADYKYYVFDNFYAEIGGKKVSFTDYVTEIKKPNTDSTKVVYTGNIEFKAAFKFVPYSIQYMIIDGYSAKDQITYIVGKNALNSFDKNGLIEGKEMFDEYASPLKFGKHNFVNGWYYLDSQGNKHEFTKNTKVSVDIDALEFENGVLKVYPQIVEYDVTLFAKGGTFFKNVNGVKKEQGTSITVKGGYFGFELPQGVTLENPGYEQIAATPWDYPAEFNDNGNIRITKKYTLNAQWEMVEYKVTLTIDGAANSTYKGNVEGKIYNDDVPELTVDIIKGKLFDGVDPIYYDYEIKLIDSERNVNFKDGIEVTRNSEIAAVKTLRRIPITLHANGGLYKGSVTNGKERLENYVGEKAVEMHGYANGGYFTKNQQSGWIDQGAPVREFYVFNGWATKENAKFGVDKIYYAYKDGSDLYNSSDKNKENYIWLGAENFKVAADGDVLIDGRAVTLYAQWVPIKTKVNYYQRDGKTPCTAIPNDFNAYFGPEDGFRSPYGVREEITWSLTIGKMDIIKNGEKVSRYATYDVNTLGAMEGNDNDGFYFTTERTVYEYVNVPIIVAVNYKNGETIIKTVNYENGMDDFFENDLKDRPLTLGSGNDKGYVFRKTYVTEDGKYVDGLTDASTSPTVRPYVYAENKIGILSGEKYTITMEVQQAEEKIPIYFRTNYMAATEHSNVTINSIINKYDEAISYPYKHLKVSIKHNAATKSFDQQWLNYYYNNTSLGSLSAWKNNSQSKLGDIVSVTEADVNDKDKAKRDSVNGEPAIIFNVDVKGKWENVDAANKIGEVKIKYTYEEEDKDGNKVTRTLKVESRLIEGSYFNADYEIPNPTPNETSESGNERRTWTVDGNLVDIQDTTVTSELVLKPNLYLTDVAGLADLVKEGSQWVVMLEAKETYVQITNS